MATGDEVAALELLQEWFEEEGHWLKGDLSYHDDAGEVVSTCLIGGVRYAYFGETFNRTAPKNTLAEVNPMTDRLSRIIREQFPERVHAPFYTIPDFNDDNRTGIEDVRLVVGKALAQAREEEGL